MPSYEEKVAGLLADSRITKEQAKELLEAGRADHPPKWWHWLLNPLSCLGSATALLLSAACVGLGMVLSRWRVRFDGAVDVHLVPQGVAWTTAFADALVSWPLPAVVFWSIARSFQARARFVDFAAAVGLARPIALLIASAGLLLTDPSAVASAQAGKIDLKLLLLGLVSLPLVGWMIAILVFGFREASGLRGGRLAFAAVLAIVLAEATSKLALAIL